MVLHYYTVKLVDVYMNHLMAKDKITPLGWTFKYRFLDIPILNVGMLLAFEIGLKFNLAKRDVIPDHK